MLLLIAGWTILPGSAIRWTLLGLLAIVAPWAIALVRELVRPPLDKSWRAYYGAVARDAWVSAQQALLAIVFLPHQALISVDAIARTGYRLLVSHRLLLEWRSALLVEQRVSNLRAESWGAMRTSVACVIGLAIVAATVQVRISWRPANPSRPARHRRGDREPDPAVAAGPLLASGSVSRRDRIRHPLSVSARAEAMRYARQHWAFFERFVTAETHWLAPDNFQSDPEPVVAMRTSPTNIGLQLLSTVSAQDLGLLALGRDDHAARSGRWRRCCRCPRYRGHFFNWYDLHDPQARRASSSRPTSARWTAGTSPDT
jgi:cyclic beta-1,2-glucan synthetase